MVRERLAGEILLLNLSRLDGYIHLANLKASLVIPANAALLGFIFSMKEDIQLAVTGSRFALGVFSFFYITAVLCFNVSLFYSVKAVFARISSTGLLDKRGSVVFFGSVREMSAPEFLKRSLAIGEDDYLSDIAGQVHILADILYEKFLAVNRSLIFFSMGFVLISLLIALVRVSLFW